MKVDPIHVERGSGSPNERGSILLLAMLVSLLLLGVGITSTWLASQQANVSGTIIRRSEAMRAAKTGLERGQLILRTDTNWPDLLQGCKSETIYSDDKKGKVLCAAGSTPIYQERVIEGDMKSATESPGMEAIIYTLWLRNDDIEGVGNADTDSRVVLRSEGRGRDGLSVVVLETIFSRTTAGGLQEDGYGQAGVNAAGSGSARVTIESEF